MNYDILQEKAREEEREETIQVEVKRKKAGQLCSY
jgi:hypothetical protein